MTTTRLSKYVSAGLRLCSRKEADEWIDAGRVLVNGGKTQLGFKVKPGDIITIKGDGELPSPTRKFQVPVNPDLPTTASSLLTLPRLFLANKGSGQICDRTKNDNFFAAIETRGAPHGLLLASGLDVMASGLMLMTDNSRLKQILEKHPLNQVFYVRIRFALSSIIITNEFK